jgi:hypothetical protein
MFVRRSSFYLLPHFLLTSSSSINWPIQPIQLLPFSSLGALLSSVSLFLLLGEFFATYFMDFDQMAEDAGTLRPPVCCLLNTLSSLCARYSLPLNALPVLPSSPFSVHFVSLIHLNLSFSSPLPSSPHWANALHFLSAPAKKG